MLTDIEKIQELEERILVKDKLIELQSKLIPHYEKIIAEQKEVIALLEAQLKEANAIIAKIEDYSNAVKALQERIK